MEKERQHPDLKPIQSGWAALGKGWAVHGKTKVEAVRLYHEAVERHREMDARSIEVGEEVAEH
jgi:hypothetical protein